MQVYIQLPKRFFKILFLFSFYRHKVLKFYYWLASLISLENLSKLTSLDIYITMVLLNRPIFELTWSHLSSFYDVWNSWLIRGQRFKGNLAFADPSILRFPLWQSQPTLQVKYISYEKFLRRCWVWLELWKVWHSWIKWLRILYFLDELRLAKKLCFC